MNIISQIQGGLGNQLFQYATGRAFAIRNHASLLLDYSWYIHAHDDVTSRELLLGELNTKGSLITFQPTIKRPKSIQRIKQKFLPANPFIFLEQAPYRFDDRLNILPIFNNQNFYLMGYWQSYKYFESIKVALQSEIKPKKPLSTYYQKYLQEIQSSQSSMVHVRRGDYVHLASAAKVHGFIGLNYYLEGMKLLLDKNHKTHFFVFSDDVAWAKQNLPHADRTTFIQSPDNSDAVIQELELMTNCQNYLIANSSLSWWGAWLSKNLKNTVICPKKWTNDTTLDLNDLLPPSWLRI